MAWCYASHLLKQGDNMTQQTKYKLLQIIVVAEYTLIAWLLLRIISGVAYHIHYTWG
jgi:hypothetical protein